ncbi:MAG: type II toxin-antitoxin system Phd/YefM family antitoxin, partial [Candidatus Neomarinimicrobiota bacterium]
MKFSESIKPISYFKTHTAALIDDITINQKPLIVTKGGEAKVVVQDVLTYERTQESLALLKILALSNRNLKAGKVKPIREAFDALDQRIGA